MTPYDAIHLVNAIEKSEKKLTSEELMNLHTVKQSIKNHYTIFYNDGKILEKTYRRVSGGGDYQDQPFKQYRRK